MANIQKRTTKSGEVSYRVQIRIKGHPGETATFNRLTDAKLWAQQTEADIRRGMHFKTAEAKKRTMGEAIDRYFRDVLSHRKNPVNQKIYLNWWKKQLGSYILADVTPALIVEKRNALVGSHNNYGRIVGSATANRYTQALGHVYTIANKEWGWVSENPVSNITKFKEPRGRVRFLSEEERNILLLFTIEGGIIGTIGSTIAFAAGFIFVSYLQKHGIPFSAESTGIGNDFPINDRLYLYFEPLHAAIFYFVGIAVSVISALYPAVKAVKLEPVEALKG